MKAVIEILQSALTELEKETVSPIQKQTKQGIENLIARAEGKVLGGKSHLPPILGVAMNVQKNGSYNNSGNGTGGKGCCGG